jgi:hypothetical protein
MGMKKIDISCKNCQVLFTVSYKERKRKFCSTKCVSLFQTGEKNPSFGKTYRTKETHPEWAKKVSKTHLEKGYISGEKNPMKNPEIAVKAGKKRSERFKSDENFKNMTRELVKKAWAEGKFDGVKVGKCKWFDFEKSDGSICKLQGTWELAYARWLQNEGVNFVAHKGRIKYKDENGSEKSYYPDFYLPDSDEYIDIKNKYHFSLNEKKWENIKKSNPELKIRLVFDDELKEKNIL